MEKNESKDSYFPFAINMDIDILLPKEKRTSFQESFSYLRKKLQIKLSRKTYIDSMLKKCKARFFKAIYECLKKCTIKHIIQKFPQSFIINTSIENNKNIFEKSCLELYKDFNFSPINVDTFIKEGKCIKGKEEYFRYIYTSKISKLYILYTQSKRYKSELETIKKYLGIKMSLLYKFVAENFINYYLFTKPHYCKKSIKNIKNISNDDNDISNAYKNNKKNITNNNHNKNKDFKTSISSNKQINNSNFEQNKIMEYKSNKVNSNDDK